MEEKEVIRTIRTRWKEFYPASKDRKGIICPLCGHGGNGDGIVENPKGKNPGGLKCFSCGFSGDVIALRQMQTGAEFVPTVQSMAAELGLTIDSSRPQAAQNAFESSGIKEPTPQAEKPAQRPAEAAGNALNYGEYYQRCAAELQKNPAGLSYLSGRGISAATAARFGIGFDPSADPARNPGGSGQTLHPCPRIIIPTSPAHYVARSIDPNTPANFRKMNPAGSTPGIFNAPALWPDDPEKPVFVTEGAFDALSIIEAGAAAVALNSTANVRAMLARLEQRPTKATLILCLDSDQAGRKASAELQEGLNRLNVCCCVENVCGNWKDPNEYLQHDREGFTAAIQDAQRGAAARPDSVAQYINFVMPGEIERFKRTADTKTGYPNLDRLSGGLNVGLYCLAAVSSLGKTTFAAQMADQLAAAGHDVLFFSLEQSRLELVTKSFSRMTAKEDPASAVTSLQIRRGYLPQQVTRAAAAYQKDIGDRLSIIEANFNCNASFIGDYVRRYIRQTGQRPIVFIDYLQILQPDSDKRQTAKEVVDANVTALKRLSREEDITIFVISSVNRMNYLTPIDFESLKESGSIEYSCDCVWGLQLACLNEPLFADANKIKEKREKVKQEKAAIPRRIELVCLKNRYGIANFSCRFDYDPAHDLFTPAADEDTPSFAPAGPKKAGRKL